MRNIQGGTGCVIFEEIYDFDTGKFDAVDGREETIAVLGDRRSHGRQNKKGISEGKVPAQYMGETQ